MSETLYTFSLNLKWELITKLNIIDRFNSSWAAIKRRESQTLKQLKFACMLRNVGSSAKIEGSRMTDNEVELLLRNLEISKLEEEDHQEVAGYFEVLNLISESFNDIPVSEINLLHLHSQLMKYSQKDGWHKGKYKQHSNALEVSDTGGTKYTVCETMPGFSTKDAIKKLVAWYNKDRQSHPIVRLATFTYEFLSIRPFQHGNSRMSRLLTTLLLLQQGYSWISYVSFEHEIESRKSEYYKVLMDCQRHRPGENIDQWIMFFLDCLQNIQDRLIKKLVVDIPPD